MWRRLSTHFQTLVFPHRTCFNPARIVSCVAPIPSSSISRTSFTTRYFSSDAGGGNVPKSDDDEEPLPKLTVDDIDPLMVGPEREELEAELEGRDLYEYDYPSGPFGTEDAPAYVKSYFNKRIVGCPGGLGEDEHEPVWFWLEKDKPHICPECNQYFMLEVIGKGGEPFPLRSSESGREYYKDGH